MANIAENIIDLDGAETQKIASKLRVLVVDDSKLQREILSLSLKRWGFNVAEAAGGQEALEICKSQDIDLVLSDWMMPGMDGLEFCKEFRKLDRDRYGYFILLTSKNEKNDVALGLDIGADDFLSKPVNSTELKARLRAGTRVLDMEQKLIDQNETVANALTELQNLYDAINKDLIEAEKLQQSLIPVRHIILPQGEVSILFQSCGHVGGDLVGCFNISETRLGLYSLDVSGHGVSSALLTARLAGYLSPHDKEQNVVFERLPSGGYKHHPPEKIAEILNSRMMQELDTEHYFTFAFADIDLVSGHVTMVQAGHPHPVVFNSQGVTYHGAGGYPIGLMKDLTFDSFDFQLSPGDRLMLYSDGLTECESGQGELLDETGLEEVLSSNMGHNGPEFMTDILWQLTEYVGESTFSDDLSAIMFEFTRYAEPKKF